MKFRKSIFCFQQRRHLLQSQLNLFIFIRNYLACKKLLGAPLIRPNLGTLGPNRVHSWAVALLAVPAHGSTIGGKTFTFKRAHALLPNRFLHLQINTDENFFCCLFLNFCLLFKDFLRPIDFPHMHRSVA